MHELGKVKIGEKMYSLTRKKELLLFEEIKVVVPPPDGKGQEPPHPPSKMMFKINKNYGVLWSAIDAIHEYVQI
jgi:hypothetical protein